MRNSPTALVQRRLSTTVSLALQSSIPMKLTLDKKLSSDTVTILTTHGCQRALRAFSVNCRNEPRCSRQRRTRTLTGSLRLPFRSIRLSARKLISFFPRLIATVSRPVTSVTTCNRCSIVGLTRNRKVGIVLDKLKKSRLF